MSGDDLFIDDSSSDDGAKPAAKPSFDPFAGESVNTNEAAPVKPTVAPKPITDKASTGPADPFAADPVDVQATPKPIPPKQKPAAPAKPDADPFSGEAVDTGPGPGAPGGEDSPKASLWECPHCGAKNKAHRDTCRSCGKSPVEPVAKPVFTQPWFIGAIAAVVVVLALLMLGGGPSFDRKPARMSHLDASLRVGGSAGGSHAVGSASFVVKGQFAITGRVLDVSARDQEGAKLLSAWLVVGNQAKIGDEDFFNRLQTKELNHKVELFLDGKPAPLSDMDFALVHIIDEQGGITANRGDIISLTGQHGTIADWDFAKQPRDREYVVRPTETVSVAAPSL